MPQVTGIIQASQLSVQTVASASYEDVACETAALADGVDYLVWLRGSCGADSSSRLAHLQLLHGATQIAEAGGEAAAAAATGFCSPALCGVRKVTGDGSSTLKFQSKRNAGTGRAQAMSAIAIPMTLFGTEGADYHASMTNAADEVVSDATTADWTDVMSVDWDFGASQDWLILGSFETDFDALTADRGTAARLLVDGVALDCLQSKDGEDPLDIMSWAFGTLETLSGVKTIKLQVISSGTAETDVRRPNLIAIRKDHWNQIARTQYESTRQVEGDGTYTQLTELDTTVAPVSAGAHVLTMVAGNCSISTFAHTALAKLRNATDATDFCTDSGDSQNNNADDACLWVAACEALAGAKDYEFWFRSSDAAADARVPSNDDERVQLIAWELATPDAPASTTVDPILMGSVF